MTTARTQTRAEILDKLWAQLNRPDHPQVELIGEEASTTLACLADLAYFQHGREIDFETVEGGYRVSLGDPVTA